MYKIIGLGILVLMFMGIFVFMSYVFNIKQYLFHLVLCFFYGE